MAVPLSQMYTVAKYVLSQKLKGVKRYPLVLMLEPLFRCNLACAGCGKIQYPDHVLDKRLTPEQCWAAAEECGAPIVSIPGGEPLIHPEMAKIVRRPGCAGTVRLPLHQRHLAGAKARRVPALEVSDVQRSHGRPERRA